MSEERPDAPHEERPADPWQAFGYLVSGMLLWGGGGWLLDAWLGTKVFVAVGIVVGTGLALYLTFLRYGKP